MVTMNTHPRSLRNLRSAQGMPRASGARTSLPANQDRTHLERCIFIREPRVSLFFLVIALSLGEVRRDLDRDTHTKLHKDVDTYPTLSPTRRAMDHP